MSYCKKKIINYGTVCDFLEQIAQTFENNGVVPFTVTRTNLPYDENVSDTPSVTCDWDNVRISFVMSGSMVGSSKTTAIYFYVYQKNINNNEYVNVYSSYFFLDFTNSNAVNNQNTTRKASFNFVKNNEGVGINIYGYNNELVFLILSDITTQTTSNRLYYYYSNNTSFQKIQDINLDYSYSVDTYNKPLDSNNILLQYQIPVTYCNSSSDIRYLTTLKNTSAVVGSNLTSGAFYTLNTKSGKKTYLTTNCYDTRSASIKATYMAMECGDEVTSS